MKQFLVVLLLAGGLLSLIIFLDIIIGKDMNGIIWKTLNPFRVMEAAEYLIVLLLILFLVIKSFKSYKKKKRQRQSPTN